MSLSFFSNKRKATPTGSSPPSKQSMPDPAVLLQQAQDVVEKAKMDDSIKILIKLMSACLSKLIADQPMSKTDNTDSENAVVVFKLPEANPDLKPSEARAHDHKVLDDLCDAIGFAPDVLSVRRLGGRSDRGPRPLLVRLPTAAEKRIFLAQARKNPASKSKGTVAPAMNRKDRLYNKMLHDVRFALRAEIPNLVVYNSALMLSSTSGRPTPVPDQTLAPHAHIYNPIFENYVKQSESLRSHPSKN